VKGARSDQAVRRAFATFLRGVLDCTDDWRGGRPGRRPAVRAYDGDDVFVAVAAGEGTETLLDVAHEVAGEHGWWLPGSFASGGVRGYDPQTLRVTARGAWECVRSHLREAGRVVDDPIVVVGTGDMTDEFFGGAMLDSAVRLRAAVSRRYFFIDPDPDPDTSLAERRRLARTHQGWEGYDVSKLSKGGMILSRSAARVQLPPETRVLLGLEGPEVTGDQLAAAIIGARADVLWTGAGESAPRLAAGAGETAAGVEIGLGAHELRAIVVAQGDPRGLTPDACAAYARAGGRANSYAVDGGAGLDLGDHEITLKVLLEDASRPEAMGAEEREQLFRDAAAEVVTRVLARVRSAHRSLSADLERYRRWPAGHRDVLSWVRDTGPLAAALDQLSADATMTRLCERPVLARPELALLLVCSKLALRESLLTAPALLDEPLYEPFLLGRFPRRIRERIPAAVRRHPLRREIIASELANELVDVMGASFVPRVAHDLCAGPSAVADAWVVARGFADAASLRDAIWRHDGNGAHGAMDAAARHGAEATLVTALERLSVWTLRAAGSGPAARLMRDIGAVVAELRAGLPACFSRGEAERYERRVTELEVGGLDGDTARRLAVLAWLDGGLDAALVAAAVGVPWQRAARLYYRLGTWVDLGWLASRIAALDGDDVWQHRAVLGLAEDLREARRRLVRRLIAAGATGAETEPLGLGGSAAERVVRLATDLQASGGVSLAGVHVVVRALRHASEDG
jgi:glutamate dehydrogenase